MRTADTTTAFLILLLTYITAIVSVRNKATDVIGYSIASDCILAALLLQFGSAHNWPTLLPVALFQTVLMVGYLASRSILPQYTNIVALESVVVTLSLILYGILPNLQGFHRWITVLSFLITILPLIYTVPLTTPEALPEATLDRLKLACEASDLVYKEASSATLNKAADFVHDTNTGAKCAFYTAPNGDVYVSFAGSESKVDWLKTNVDVSVASWVVPCDSSSSQKEVVVHAGFLDAWTSISEEVWTTLQTLFLDIGGAKSIIFTGHSLGGALATLAGLDITCRLRNGQYNNEGFAVLTFGSPVVGNQRFVETFNRLVPLSVRTEGVYDPVPHIIIRDFVHVKGSYVVNTDRGTGFEAKLNPSRAHELANYCAALSNQIRPSWASKPVLLTLLSIVTGVLLGIASKTFIKVY
jgi:triacylglycerol lipase